MKKRIKILNTQIDNLTMQETLTKVSLAISREKQLHHTVVNAGKIVSLQKDLELRKSVNEADIINADGQAVVWASKILNKPIKERVAGIDLFTNLLKLADEQKLKIYFLGAREKVLNILKQKIQNKYPNVKIVGSRNGYFSKDQETEIIQHIKKSEANMLFVAMPSPKKENFLHQHRHQLKNINFIMGVGGSFDVLAGKTKRAPKWMQAYGLEWFYRFIQEPKRMWKRYLLGNLKFIYLVLKEKLQN